MKRDEIRETFDHFDEDDNGAIDQDEFAELMEALGTEMSDEELAIGFDSVDTNHNGEIDFEEFYNWWNDR
jgi:Ca2+-binding EF-hand superfamily protein